MDDIEQTKKLLKKNNQIKILKFMEKVDDTKKKKLADQILKLDFEQVNRLYKNRNEKFVNEKKIEPIKYINKNKLSSKEINEIKQIGDQVIEQGKYAVVTMAGGQGTRLGWKGPKGTFKLEKVGKYIFEILTETLLKAKEEYGKEVYWYIMTSIDNNDKTINFFEKHNYFGYPKEKVKFFKQNTLPLLDFDGNLLVDKNFEIRYASDGNGGVFQALKEDKMIEDMQAHNIQWVYVCGVDNIMANMVDDVLLGLAIKNKMPSASKSVKKAYPEEKVGIFCKKNGKPAIIEYIDMNEKMIYARDDEDELLFGESNIVGHLFNIESVKELANYHFKYHCAKKKNSYIDENENEVIPNEPNSYKFEAFIFDGFEYLDDMIILRVNREDEFAPIKNATGNDSPQTAEKIYLQKYKQNIKNK